MRYTPKPKTEKNLKIPHMWYAWYPVKCVEGTWVWLENVWRVERIERLLKNFSTPVHEYMEYSLVKNNLEKEIKIDSKFGMKDLPRNYMEKF